MGKLNLVLTNGSMQLELIAVIGDNAFLKRQDSCFIVVNGIDIHNDFTCEWNFAYGYVWSYDKAYQLFIDKVVKPFMEYEDVINLVDEVSDNKEVSDGEDFDEDFEDEDICSDDDFAGMTIEDLTGIPYNPLT
jgi:hypothetical protein